MKKRVCQHFDTTSYIYKNNCKIIQLIQLSVLQP